MEVKKINIPVEIDGKKFRVVAKEHAERDLVTLITKDENNDDRAYVCIKPETFEKMTDKELDDKIRLLFERTRRTIHG